MCWNDFCISTECDGVHHVDATGDAFTMARPVAADARDTLGAVVRGYVECALWSELDDDGETLDKYRTVDNVDEETMRLMYAECREFMRSAGVDYYDYVNRHGAAQFGHDFWLTRNHHGAGFWDRGDGALGQRLTELAHPWGEAYLYIGDDGRIHQ